MPRAVARCEAEQRRREADLAAEMSRTLLRGRDLRGGAAGRRASAWRRRWTCRRRRSSSRRWQADERRLVVPAARGRSRRSRRCVLPADLPEPVARARAGARRAGARGAARRGARARRAARPRSSRPRALRRSDVLKTALLRAVSHDLRTPLTAIIAAAEPLGRRAHRRRRAARARERRRAGGRAPVAADRQAARPLAPGGRGGASRAATGARSTRSCAPPSTRSRLRRQFGLALDPELPLVRADAAQLERAFANLLENARATPAGTPCRCARGRSRDRVLVRIVDRGPGIPPSRARAGLRAVLSLGQRSHRPPRLGPRPGDRARLRRGQRRRACGPSRCPGQGTSFVVELPLEPTPAAAPTTASAA